MSPHVRVFFLTLLLFLSFVSGTPNEGEGSDSCEKKDEQKQVIGKIGGVFYEGSCRVGKELKIAMEMAAHDFHISNCKVVSIIRNSSGKSDRVASAAIDLIEREQVEAIIGTVLPPEAFLISNSDQVASHMIPIISISPTATSLHPSPPPSPPPPLIQLSNHIAFHTQCIAAIVGHFQWRKVTAILEQAGGSGFDSGGLAVTQLSDSLDRVNSVVQRHSTFPPLLSLSNPAASVEEELMKLKRKSNRVFVVLQASLEFAMVLFHKAKEIGMMEKGYVWIVSDGIASLLDSVDDQFIAGNMQGVIGFKTDFVDTSQDYRHFKLRFRKRYGQEYPEEEEYSNPSLFALRAYDATWTIAKAMKKLQAKNDSRDLLKSILSSGLRGLSGDLSFSNGELSSLPTFRIINVVGRSYREMAFWSPLFGFSEGQPGKKSTLGEAVDELGTMYWPGGTQKVPRGWSLGSEEKPLKVGVPGRGAFNQFVKINNDPHKNRTFVSGFSVDVFEAAVRHLPYHLPYVLVPYNGSYDDMIDAVHNKSLDAAVGDTEIMAFRYENAEFSQPYLESGLVMVVTVKPDKTKELWMFMKAFKLEMWVLLPAIHLLTSLVVWFIENQQDNPDFGGTLSHQFAMLLWFSFSVIFFAQRESIRSNLSKIVLALWLCVILIVAACFTAVLSSMITVSRLQPSVIDIEYLKSTNAAVGCNERSFIMKYLTNVLHFKIENIREIHSISDYPRAFETGEIAAAFFVEPHAKVFLAKYCVGYTRAGPSFKLGGFGFVFPKGSPLVTDISEAVLKVTQSGEILEMEKQMLSSSNCSSSTSVTDNPSLGPWPFTGLFIISGGISTIAFVITIVRVQELSSPIFSYTQVTEITKRIWRSASSSFPRIYMKFESQNSARGISCIQERTNNQSNVTDNIELCSMSIELAGNQATVITCNHE